MSSISLSSFRPSDAHSRPIEINIADTDQALDVVAERAATGQGYLMFTVNLDHLVKMRADQRLRAAYERAQFVTADGWPVVWLLKKQAGAQVTRTTDADLLEPIAARAAALRLPIYFIGPGAQAQTVGLDVLRARYPALQIAGAETPDLPTNASAAYIRGAARRITASGARICIVSLGAPKGEILAAALHTRCPGVGLFSFGAALDFISGEAKRAPLWARRYGFEWLHRLAQNPRRLLSRYAGCALLFARLAVATALHRSVGLVFVRDSWRTRAPQLTPRL